jgi:hypothetical protein
MYPCHTVTMYRRDKYGMDWRSAKPFLKHRVSSEKTNHIQGSVYSNWYYQNTLNPEQMKDSPLPSPNKELKNQNTKKHICFICTKKKSLNDGNSEKIRIKNFQKNLDISKQCHVFVMQWDCDFCLA